MKLFEIVWDDITSYSGWNEDVILEGKDDPWRFTTVGYLVKKDKTKVIISDTNPEIGNITIFPIGCIVEMREI